MREFPSEGPSAAAVQVTVRDGFAPAIDEAAAAADPRHAFLRAGWFAADGGEEARTLVATQPDDGRVIAALPVCRMGRKPVRAVPGSYWPYRSFPIAADATDEQLVSFLSSRTTRAGLGPFWRLGPVYEDDPTAARLLALAPAAGWTMLRRSLGTDYLIDLAALIEAGEWPRPSTLKKNRYSEKQLAASGALDWRFVSGSGWTPEIFDALADIEGRSWVSDTDRSGAKFVARPKRRSWESVRQDPVLAGMMTAAILTIGGRPAAFSFDLDVGTTKHVIANSYDQAFARHSPGRVLAYRNLSRAAERGITKVDWGSGDGGYKSIVGAEPGPKILDLLFVRNRALAAALRPIWSRASG